MEELSERFATFSSGDASVVLLFRGAGGFRLPVFDPLQQLAAGIFALLLGVVPRDEARTVIGHQEQGVQTM